MEKTHNNDFNLTLYEYLTKSRNENNFVRLLLIGLHVIKYFNMSDF